MYVLTIAANRIDDKFGLWCSSLNAKYAKNTVQSVRPNIVTDITMLRRSFPKFSQAIK